MIRIDVGGGYDVIEEARKLLAEIAYFPVSYTSVLGNCFLNSKTRFIKEGEMGVVSDFSENDLVRLRNIVSDMKDRRRFVQSGQRRVND